MGNRLRASQDVQVLDSFAERLLQLVRQTMDSQLHHDENDHLAFMALCFVSKQAEHLQSARALVHAGSGRDAALIARSMIEGLSLLLWAAQDPSTRALDWRRYGWIEDWRLMREKDQSRETVVESARAAILDALKQFGHRFLTRKAVQAQKQGRPLPADPYREAWHGRSVRSIFEQVHGERLHGHVYNETSRWIHWSPRGLAAAIRREGDHIRYVPPTSEWAATALAAGFQALIESAILMDSHLKLGFAQRLTNLRSEYIARLVPDDEP